MSIWKSNKLWQLLVILVQALFSISRLESIFADIESHKWYFTLKLQLIEIKLYQCKIGKYENIFTQKKCRWCVKFYCKYLLVTKLPSFPFDLFTFCGHEISIQNAEYHFQFLSINLKDFNLQRWFFKLA